MQDRPIQFLVSHSSPGGVQEIWANLAEGFRERGYRAGLMALYPPEGAEHPLPDSLTWDYVVATRPRSARAQLQMLRTLTARFRAERPLRVFTAMPAANVLAPLAAQLAGLAAVVISHHSPVETHNSVLNRIDGWTGALSSVIAVVSVSDAVSRSLEGKPAAYRAKRLTIHNALPPRVERLISEIAVARVARAARGRKAVAIGRLAAQKNYPMLIRAAARMPAVEVHIIGSGPDEALLRQLSFSEGVHGSVHFAGQQSRERALTMLAEADVFVQVSRYEGHSLALIEAAKLGLPLVVSDVPTQVEGVTAIDGTRCAAIVPLDDADSLATAVSDLLHDEACYAHGAWLATKLASAATFERMLDAYESLVDQESQ